MQTKADEVTGTERSELVITDRWWPTLGERAVEIDDGSVPMGDGERALAERERESRKKRLASPGIVYKNQIELQPSSHKGVYVGSIVSPHMGLQCHIMAAEIHHFAPGASTELHRHSERLVHVLTGSGYSVIEGQRFDWEPGDSIHIKEGLWHQHFNTGKEPVNWLVGMPTPMLESMYPHPTVYKGDSFSDLPDDYEPEHPFGLGLQEIIPVDVERWMSSAQLHGRKRRDELKEQLLKARTIMKWNEAKIERSQHKGDWHVSLIASAVGFDPRMLSMAMFQLPPDCHTETHKHEEAIVYILSGHGFSIIDGERLDWEAGDCFHVQPASWHQHWNTDKEKVSQQIAFRVIGTLLERFGYFPGLEVQDDPSKTYATDSYQPKLPWEFDYSVPWPKRV